MVPADDIQGKVAADWAAEMGVKRVFVLHDREVYGKGIAEIFPAVAPRSAACRCSASRASTRGPPATALLVTKIKEQNPELVYFGGTTQSGGQLAKDLVAGGADVKFMVPDGCFENAFIDGAGASNLNGRAYITFGAYRRRCSRARAPSSMPATRRSTTPGPRHAVYGYEAGKVALHGIATAGKKDRDAIRAAIVSIKNFDGALGNWSFDENGDTSLTTMSGNTVKDGKFEFVKVLGQGQ